MTDLSDAALRERADSISAVFGDPVSRGAIRRTLDVVLAEHFITLRDAARAEQAEEIAGLREALGVMGANYDEAATRAKRVRAEQREADAQYVNDNAKDVVDGFRLARVIRAQKDTP